MYLPWPQSLLLTYDPSSDQAVASHGEGTGAWRRAGYHVFTKVFVIVSRKMISISMIVDKHQYYTVMVPDSQAWRPRIITNLPICAEIHGPKNMASKIFTRHLK